MTQDETPTEPSRMTEKDIREHAIGLQYGSLFTNWHIPEDEAPIARSIFMPVAFGALNNIDVTKVGAICEWLSEAGPRAINGYPCFFSCRVIHIDDWQEIITLYDRLQAAQDGVLGGD